MTLLAIATTDRGVFVHETKDINQEKFLKEIIEKHRYDTSCQVKISIRPMHGSSAH